MKFPKEQYVGLTKALDEAGIDRDQVQFIKRRGWIHVIIGDKFFAYFLRKETRLDPSTRQWVHHWYFSTKCDSGLLENASDLDQLVSGFKKWLASGLHNLKI